MRFAMTAARWSGHITGAVAATIVAVGMIAASVPTARANDATVMITNGTRYPLKLKSASVDGPYSWINWTLDTLAVGSSQVVARASSAWPWTVSPTLVYWIGDTGKTVRIRMHQLSPYPEIEFWCPELPEGQPPLTFGCIGDGGFGRDYTSKFYLKRNALRRASRSRARR